MAAIALIDVLDHLFAPLVLEIDIDVRRLLPLLGQKAREQNIDLLGIDIGDAEHEADDGIGGRAAPLAENAFVVGKPHDVVDRQEIARIVELLDERELLAQAGPRPFPESRPDSGMAARVHTRSSRWPCGVFPGGTGSSG